MTLQDIKQFREGHYYMTTDEFQIPVQVESKDLLAWYNGARYGKPIEITPHWCGILALHPEPVDHPAPNHYAFISNNGRIHVKIYFDYADNPRPYPVKVWFDGVVLDYNFKYVHELQGAMSRLRPA